MCASISGSSQRRGYTLLELVVTLGTSAILVAGLTSTLFISTKALTPDATASAENNRTSLVLSQLTGDLRLALGFAERTTKAVTFTVPDRTGDLTVETVRYSWSGTAGDPLVYQFNGGTAINVATNVQQFNLSALTRTIAASSVVTPLTVSYPTQVPLAETAHGSGVTSIVIAAPRGLVPGDTMIAAVAVDGSVAASMTATGWTLIDKRANGSSVTLGVWRQTVSIPAASYTFTWSTSQKAYGWIMRFSGADSSTPINASSFTTGTSNSANCLTANTTTANTLVLRICAIAGDPFTVDAQVVPSHTTITLDKSGVGSASGGAAYSMQATVGATNSAAFGLTATRAYVSGTIAIAPENGL